MTPLQVGPAQRRAGPTLSVFRKDALRSALGQVRIEGNLGVFIGHAENAVSTTNAQNESAKRGEPLPSPRFGAALGREFYRDARDQRRALHRQCRSLPDLLLPRTRFEHDLRSRMRRCLKRL